MPSVVAVVEVLVEAARRPIRQAVQQARPRQCRVVAVVLVVRVRSQRLQARIIAVPMVFRAKAHP